MLKLGRALSHGYESFLGRVVERPHIPTLIQNDMDQQSMSAQMYHLGFTGKRPADVYYDKVANGGALRDHVIGCAARNPTGLIMIDTFSATFLDVKQNDAECVTDAYKALAEWHPRGPILISHHCNKPDGHAGEQPLRSEVLRRSTREQSGCGSCTAMQRVGT